MSGRGAEARTEGCKRSEKCHRWDRGRQRAEAREGPWGRRVGQHHSGKGEAGVYLAGSREEEEEGRDSFGMVSRELRTPGGRWARPSLSQPQPSGLPAQPSLDVSTGSRQRTERMEGSSTTGAEQGTQHVPTLACLVLEETDTPRTSKTRRIYKRAYCVLGTPPACPHAIGTDSGNNITTPPCLITAEFILLPFPHPVKYKSL